MESVSHLALKLLSLMGDRVGFHKGGWVDYFRLPERVMFTFGFPPNGNIASLRMHISIC